MVMSMDELRTALQTVRVFLEAVTPKLPPGKAVAGDFPRQVDAQELREYVDQVLASTR